MMKKSDVYFLPILVFWALILCLLGADAEEETEE